ncbi:MAG TPA: redoxin domain-containing protein, partial [Sulfurovum sp.]|nr:redoxin domain-containing protein [Sulfurovum sp.]
MNKWNIRSIFKEIVIALALLFILSNTISYIRAPELGSNQLPKLEIELLDGSQFSVKKGKPLIIHFWSTSCPACKLEAPNIEIISKKYEVLTISVNAESNEKLKAYMQKNELS